MIILAKSPSRLYTLHVSHIQQSHQNTYNFIKQWPATVTRGHPSLIWMNQKVIPISTFTEIVTRARILPDAVLVA